MKNLPNLPGFTLRELAPADVTGFIELGLPTCAFMHGRLEVSPDRMRQNFVGFVREYAFDSDSEIYIVRADDGSLAGQLWLHHTHNRFNGLNELWIWDVTVREEFRRRGIGRFLLQLAMQRAREKNCAELWLLVSSSNFEAIRLYESVGLHSAGHLMMKALDRDTAQMGKRIQLESAMLRPLGIGDVHSLYTLWTEADLEYRPNGRDREDRLLAHLGGTTIAGWGAFQSETMIAAALISIENRKGWIERLATHPNHRRAGLAKAIVTACLQSLRERGALVMAALIETENASSRRLFESVGFKNHPGLCYYSIRDDPGA